MVSKTYESMRTIETETITKERKEKFPYEFTVK